MLLRIPAIFLTAALLAFGPSAVRAEDDQSLSPKQQDAVKKLIHDYILENPSVVADALDALREKEALAAESAGKRALTEKREEILNDPDSPALGAPKSDVTLVEFFDYRDPYCRAMSDWVFDLVTEKRIRLVLKEWPLLGPESVVAAKAAIAVYLQEKAAIAVFQTPKLYTDFHKALMHQKGPLTRSVILKLAADMKLDRKQLEKEMDEPKVDEIVRKNLSLAHALAANAAPILILNGQMYTGPINKEALTKLIDDARKPKD